MRIERYARALDDLATDLVVAPLFEDERPPLGVSGLIDWRLNGFISRAILSGAVSGRRDEIILLPLHQRLPARRLLLVGLGRRRDFLVIEARHVAHKIGKAVRGLAVIDVALSFPPAGDERDPGETERAVLEVLQQSQLSHDVLLRWLNPPTHQLEPLVPAFTLAAPAHGVRS